MKSTGQNCNYTEIVVDMMLLCYYVTMLLFYCVAQEIMRRVPWIAWTSFLILPVLLSPYWIHSIDKPIFYWFKVYSVLLGCCWLLSCRFTLLHRYRWPFVIGYLIIVLNILEAVIQDFSAGHWFNYLNATAGILLIFANKKYEVFEIDLTNRYRDCTWDVPLLWVIGYTLWNWTFVYLNFPDQLGRVSLILGAALIVGVINNKLWLQARSFTLGISLLFLFTYPPMITYSNTSMLYNQTMAIIFSVLSIVWTGMYTIYYFSKKT